MLSQGNSPENPTTESITAGREPGARAEGQGRRSAASPATTTPTIWRAGNIAVAQAYSGDVVQLQADNPDLQFIVPESGGDWFIDTMVIPYTTQNQKAAEAWIDYVYDRANYAKLVAYTQYVPALSDMTDELAKIDPASAENPLINPPAEIAGEAEVLGRADRRADPGVQHPVRRCHRRLSRWRSGMRGA